MHFIKQNIFCLQNCLLEKLCDYHEYSYYDYCTSNNNINIFVMMMMVVIIVKIVC